MRWKLRGDRLLHFSRLSIRSKSGVHKISLNDWWTPFSPLLRRVVKLVPGSSIGGFDCTPLANAGGF